MQFIKAKASFNIATKELKMPPLNDRFCGVILSKASLGNLT